MLLCVLSFHNSDIAQLAQPACTPFHRSRQHSARGGSSARLLPPRLATSRLQAASWAPALQRTCRARSRAGLWCAGRCVICVLCVVDAGFALSDPSPPAEDPSSSPAGADGRCRSVGSQSASRRPAQQPSRSRWKVNGRRCKVSSCGNHCR